MRKLWDPECDISFDNEEVIPLQQASKDLATIIGHKDYRMFYERYESIENVLRLFEVLGLPASSNNERIDYSTRQFGIDSSTIEYRMSSCGANVLSYGSRNSIWHFAVESIKSDKTVQLLIGAAVLSTVLGFTAREAGSPASCGCIEGAAIISSVLIVTMVNAVNDYYKQDQFLFVHRTEDNHHNPVTAWRYHLNGLGAVESRSTKTGLQVEEVPMSSLVVGDIVRISSGSQLTFDGLLLYSEGTVIVDEVCITGESDERKKTTQNDFFLISGSSVLEGSADGIAVVCAVGPNSFSGAISESVSSTEKECTPLQKQLGVLADVIARYGVGAAVATFAILQLKDIFSAATSESSLTWSKMLSNIITAVTIVVVAVPEGLPLSVTISLAYSMRQMLQDGNLVRHLAACETMGGATILCTDKTGTLTNSNMRVSHFVIGLQSHEIPQCCERSNCTDMGTDSLGLGMRRSARIMVSWPPSVLQLLVDSLVWSCIDPELGVAVNKTGEAVLNSDVEFVSSSSAHLISSTKHTIMNFPRSRYRRFPVNSNEKIGRTVVHENNRELVFMTGAPEIVLRLCDRYLSDKGAEELLTPQLTEQHKMLIDELSADGHRVISFAFTTVVSDASQRLDQARYCLISIVALEEKLQEGVTEALEQCRHAGIRVVMITGDSRLTAVNVAQRCGLFPTGITNPYMILDGAEFRKMGDEDIILNYLPSLRRFLQLLQLYHPMDVVAMTGDGTNDAPALKLSNVGFAMESGSDVAKKAADIILLGNSFTGMVRAVMWGRGIKDNIRKFLQYQLTVNAGACLIAFLGAVVNERNISPLKPVQLLWLNLIMDSLAALALATELPSEDLLNRLPEKQNMPIITPYMWISVWVQCFFQLLVQLLLFWRGSSLLRKGLDKQKVERFGDVHVCFLFNAFVWMQIFNFFNARLLDNRLPILWGFQYSRTLLWIVFCIAITQIIVVQYGGSLMMTVPLTFSEWVYSIGLGLLALPCGKLSRWVCCRVEESPRANLMVPNSAKTESPFFSPVCFFLCHSPRNKTKNKTNNQSKHEKQLHCSACIEVEERKTESFQGKKCHFFSHRRFFVVVFFSEHRIKSISHQMHAGPKPLRPVSEAEARKEREEEEKILLNFKDLYTKRSAGDKSVNALQSTLNLLQKIPENYSLYNYRRDILLDLFQDPSKAPGLLLEELKLNSDVLKEDYKCYAAFAHRHWVYEKILEYVPDQRLIRGLIEKEFKQCEKLLQLDERNFHVWNYRRWVLALNERVQDLSGAANGHAPNFLTAEETADLLFTTRKINQNFSNYSAWHQRSFVLNSAVTRLLGATPCQEVENHWQEFYRQLRDDVELLCQAIYCDPNDQAAWFYARFVIHLFLQSEKQFNQRRSGDQCAPLNVVDILVSSVVDLLAEENASGNGEDSRRVSSRIVFCYFCWWTF
eukprot:gene4471-3265_t